MTHAPVKTAFSARLLSHCAEAEFQNGLEMRAFGPLGWSFRRFCCPVLEKGFDEAVADPERVVDDARQLGEAVLRG